MSEDSGKLVVTDEYMSRYGYMRIAWYFEEEGDYGAILGDGPVLTEEQALSKRDEDDADWEYYFINAVASKTKNVKTDEYGFLWETKKDAKAALSLIKNKLEIAKSDKKWPEWAVLALAAGWKAPKGWTP